MPLRFLDLMHKTARIGSHAFIEAALLLLQYSSQPGSIFPYLGYFTV